jgi:anti-anti-sigma factor
VSALLGNASAKLNRFGRLAVLAPLEDFSKARARRCATAILAANLGQSYYRVGVRCVERTADSPCRIARRRILKTMATPRRIKTTESGKITVVTFNDSKIIDEAEIQEFGQELYDLVERDGKKKIVLNFANVEFLSSAALGKLIGFDKRVKQHGAELILSNIRPEIYEVFAITKLTKLFVIKDDEADALAAI